jgi:hypothetical protein
MPNNKPFYDRGPVMTGIVIFVILATFPFWYNLGKAAPAPEPVLTEQAKAAKTCVEPKEYIIPEHMQLLNVWRDAVVRQGKRTYVSTTGKKYEASLSNTCLDCHSNKAEFCDKCHNYASVSVYCWDCHIENPKEKS